MKSQYISTLSNMPQIRNDNPNDVYKQPIPIDMINKFVGLDSRILIHDDTVQKQAFDQSYKNFWSFVDFNMKFTDNVPKVVENCNHTFAQSIKPPSSMTQGKLCSGVQMTYQQAREKANQL
jgi:hypothetical protein